MLDYKDKIKIVEYYIQNLDQKNIEISRIRRDLEKQNLSNEDITWIVKTVNDELLYNLQRKSKIQKANEIFWIGAFLLVFGLVMTVLTYTGVIFMGNQFLFVYGPIIGGFSLIMTSKSKSIKR